MATKVLRREVTLLDTSDTENYEKVKRGDPSATPLVSVTLHPGDEVPVWVDEDSLDEEWFEAPIDAAGSNLQDDNVYQVVKQVADDMGVEYGEGWSSEQIAAAIRYAQAQQEFVDANGDEVVDPMSGETTDVSEAYDEGRKAMSALFDESNASGNANAPDQAAPAPSRRSRGSSGGADTSSA